MERHEIDPLMHKDLLMELNSPNAEAINDDPEWVRVRWLLGSLFRKYGAFSIEILNRTTRVFQG